MRVLLDIETDSLNPSVIWCVVTKDIQTNEVRTFTEPRSLRSYLHQGIDLVIAHNGIDFDLAVLNRLWDIQIPRDKVRDTLVLSRLLDFKLPGGHSLEAWGERLKCPKLEFKDFSKYTPEMLEYCKQDVEVNHKLWTYLQRTFAYPRWEEPIKLEHEMAWFCQDMRTNGFYFDIDTASKLYSDIYAQVDKLDIEIKSEFQPEKKLDKSYKIRYKNDGSLFSKSQELLARAQHDAAYEVEGDTVKVYRWEEFNPTSSKQVCERLYGMWSPIDRTKAASDANLKNDKEKLKHFEVYGWKISETNLGTLHEEAPKSAKLLVRRLLLGSRLKQLETWMKAYDPGDHCLHSNLHSIGTWTHRLSSTNPNLQNIAAEKSIKYHTEELKNLAIDLGGKFRGLFQAKPGKVLVGTDMESAHLRLFAHYVNDPALIKALVSGDKKDGTDPHSLNKRIIGSVCADRDRAKTFIFTFLNGGGAKKVAEIFGCPYHIAQKVLSNFIDSYPGLKHLKENVFPKVEVDGYFTAIDGRRIPCPIAHYAMAGYLQSGEKIVMSKAASIWQKELTKLSIPYWPINWVHDEFQTETDTEEHAHIIGKIQSQSIKQAGIDLGIVCPLDGEYKIGYTWLETH